MFIVSLRMERSRKPKSGESGDPADATLNCCSNTKNGTFLVNHKIWNLDKGKLVTA